MVGRYLEDLENQIDEAVETCLFQDWKDFCDGKFTGDIFKPRRIKKYPSTIEWPEVTVNQAIEDFDQMALQQFGSCSRALSNGTGEILCVRSNYGTSIIPSLFGVKIFYMEEHMNTLPTSWPLVNSLEEIETILEQGIPDLYQSFGRKTLEMGKYFVNLTRQYPKIKRHVHIYHPDLQGPMDICELLLGSQLFLFIMDAPTLIKKLLSLITDTYIAFMNEWKKIVGTPPSYSAHWSMLHKGEIMLRDDSAMNFSPAMFDEFIKPYDQRLLEEFDGGAIHFCGRGDHYIASMSQMSHLHAIHLSQPELNDMEQIYFATADRGLKIIGLPHQQALTDIENGKNLHGQVQCFDV